MSTTCDKDAELLHQNALFEKLPQNLEKIAEKVMHGTRLSHEEGLTLLLHEDERAIGRLADFVRKKKAGDTVYFATTLYIHPTNLCELSCPLCSFY